MKDLIIIGGGPAGYTAAEMAAKAGLNVTLFEQNALGGTCLNVGCIPTKALLYSAKQYASARSAAKYGINVTEVTADYAKMVARKQKIVRKLVAGIKLRLKEVEVIAAHAEVVSASADRVVVTASGVEYEAARLLLATGSENFVPPIPGIDDPRVMDSTTALERKELPASVAIIGGGVIGMEFATLYHELGVKVMVIEAAQNILPNIDPDIVAYLRAKYEKEGMTILTDTKVADIASLDAEAVLVCVGRRPVLPEGWQSEWSELPNVWMAGDVTRRVMLAHVASRQAEVAVHEMLGVEDVVRYDAIPSVVYTHPEIASVGARAEEGDRVCVIPMTYSGRFVAENEGENGLIKVVLKSDRIIGVHMVGNPCSEFVAAATMAIEAGMSVEQFRRIIFPHPTVSEILKEALTLG